MRATMLLHMLRLAVLMNVAPLALAETPAERAQFCKACHRPGNSVLNVPQLEGQIREYLVNQLRAFKEKRRPSDGHQRYWAGLSEDDMRGVADYFASGAPVRETFDVDPRKLALGKSRAEALKCAACHMSNYSGKEAVPRLAGLPPLYAAAQISAIAAGRRPHPRSDGYDSISADEAEALGQYFASVQ